MRAIVASSESGSGSGSPKLLADTTGLRHVRLDPHQVVQVEVESRQTILAGEEGLRLADLLRHGQRLAVVTERNLTRGS